MPLPIDTVLPELQTALGERTAAVLQAPPGAGKTTRVPLALLDAPWLAGRRIVMLEPRRLAARAAARFMASQLGEPVGQTVGYRMRLDTRVSAATRIEVVTEGVLTRLLQEDPELSRYGAVIFDEFHERSLPADLGLALTLEAQQALREDLRILVMSATLDGEPISRLLGGAPLITSEGRAYPVAVRYAPPGRIPIEPHLVETVLRALREESGSVLVFLPGTGEIRKTARLLEGRLPPDAFLAPLYGELSQADQDAAIAPAPAGRRKVVLATSIAETSLTIEGVRVVVDAGLQRRPEFDPISGLSRLVTVRVSQAAAEQRKGRAGRLEPGVCYRLWPEAEHSRLAAFSVPEIREADLAPLVLELAQWGALSPEQLAWLDLPPAPAWEQAKALLQRLRALDAEGRITDHGRRLLGQGLHPRLSHLLLSGRARGWGRLAAELAALLSERDVFAGSRHTDVYERIRALRGEHTAYQADRGRLARVREMAKSLGEGGEGGERRPEPSEAAALLLALAYPERIAQRRPGKAPRFLLANGRGALLADDDPLREAPYLVAAELDGDPREARVFLAGALARETLESEFAGEIRTEAFVSWDFDAVQARRQRRLGALVLEDAPLDKPDPALVSAALLEGLRAQGLDVLPWSEPLRQWRARLALLRRLEPQNWPDLGDEALLASLEEWLAPYAQGIGRLSQLKNVPLREALESLLSYEQRRALDAQAPSHYEVPSGSRIALDYASGDTPVLAVKLQEMFGARETPRIAGGRVALMLHLLSPAQRPVQVTQDLAGFWGNTYHEVRKDLRGRYPRHPWPDDPLQAPPTRRAKPRGQ